NGLQADTKVALRDVTFFQQRVNDAIDGGRGNRDRAEAGETRRSDSDDAALRVNYRAPDGGGLQTHIEANVGREGSAGPSAALGDDEANGAESRDWAAGSGAADDQRQAAGFYGANVAESRSGSGCFCGFQ